MSPDQSTARGLSKTYPHEAADSDVSRGFVALVALVDRLQLDNRELAGQVASLRAELDQRQVGPRIQWHRYALAALGNLGGRGTRSCAIAVARVRPSRLARDVAFVVLPGIVLYLVLAQVVQTFQVVGASMEPALESGQLLLINKAAYWRLVGRPQRGDVVVFRMPAPPAADLVKRVVGLPGDQVLIRDGTLVVNGQEIDEPYVTTPAAYSYPEDGRPVQVPDDAYFVLGDNRPDSVDSHLGWYVPADNIIGRAWLSYWPLARWGVLRASPARTAEPGLNPPRSPDMLHVSPTGEPEPTPVAKSLATLVDDQFTAPLPGWPNNPSSTAWFGDGGYHLLAREAGRFVAVGVPMPAPRRNVIVSARFRKVGGPSGGGYGLIVRDTGPGPRDGLDQGGHYYVFEAGDRGEVGLWRRDQNRWIDLVPWSKSGVVRTGTAPNELEARASGDQLTLTVNGTVVATQTDAQLGSGGIGVFLGGDGNEAVLDRLVVQAADEDTSATGTSIDS